MPESAVAKIRWNRNPRAIRLLAIGAMAVAIGLFTSGSNPDWLPEIGKLEDAAQGLRFSLCAKSHPEWTEAAKSHVVLVPIEDTTLQDPKVVPPPGQPPIPRDRDARVVDQLSEAGARVVVFDLLFEDERPEDYALRAAIERAKARGCAVVSSATWQSAGDAGPAHLQLPNAFLLDGTGLRIGHARTPLVSASGDAPVATAVVDRIEPVISVPQTTVALALEAVRSYLANGGREPAIVVDRNGWRCGSLRIPEDPANPGTLAIHYFGPPASENFNFFVSLPFQYVWHGGAQQGLPGQPNFFRNKIVLIGDTTPLSHDFYNTPFGTMSGLEIQAHTIATLLTGAWVRHAPLWTGAVSVLLLASVTMALGFQLRSGFALLWALVLFGLYLVFDLSLFCSTGWVWPVASPLLAGMLGLLGSTLERSWWQERERARLRTVATQYVSEQVASHGAPTGRVTLVFTDIQDSARLSLYLGQNFERERGHSFRLQREAAREYNGFEVETAGDSLFLVFEHPADAVRFALAAQVKLMSHPWPPTIGRLKVRMGIHTGTPFIDRDRQRLTYRGPDTNLASRVASAADGGEILVTESVRAATSAEFLGKVHFLSRGPVQLKGLDDHELFQVIASEQAL